MIEKLAEQLAEAGVKEAFGVSGSGPTWKVITAMEKRGVRYYAAGHEGAGAIMAGAAGKAGDRLGASLSIKGPGLANMAAGIAYNHFENLPVVSLSEAYSPNDPPSRMHKRMDQETFLRPLVKASIPLDQACAELPAWVDLARAEVPGPLHINLANGVTTAKPAADAISRNTDDWQRALDLVTTAKRPVIIAGAWASGQKWAPALNDLQTPVFTTAAAKGLVDENRPHCAGLFTGAGKKLAPEVEILREADLVIALGLRNLEILGVKPFACSTIFIDDVFGATISGLDPKLQLKPAEGDVESIFARVNKWGVDLVALRFEALRDEYAKMGWLPWTCFEALNSWEMDHALVVDTGSFCTLAEHAWIASTRRPFFGSSNGRFMGGGIPSAIGAAIGAPGRAIVCATGDGGMRMYPGEIKIAVAESLPICFTLMRDGCYSSIACATADPMSRRAVDLPNPSWRRVIEGMGCPAVEVKSRDEFDAAVRGWDAKGPLFVEAIFDPAHYLQCTKDLR